MIAGRKLLLADDSLAIQKVIDLTFTDEGMEVTTVGDGQHAWDSLDQLEPDVVLADVFMPGVDGYSLCERIKQNERFGSIPVILLVGSFEPFDEAEARRVGADDVVTKPFQSIRQLVSRVGSLLGTNPRVPGESPQFSTLGLEPNAAPASDDSVAQPTVTVLAEAPTMTELEASNVAGKSCSTDIDLQTADTMKLPSIDKKLTSETKPQTDSVATVDSPPNDEVGSESHSTGVLKMNDMSNQTLQQQSADVFNDAFLDLDDFGIPSAATAEDFILDLESERSRTNDDSSLREPYLEHQSLTVTAEVIEAESADVTEAHQTDGDERLTIVPAVLAEEHTESATTAREHVTSEPEKVDLSNLSPEVVDMIARRAVEHLSEKVVREIAWEVVPELAELLIKKRLEEQQH